MIALVLSGLMIVASGLNIGLKRAGVINEELSAFISVTVIFVCVGIITHSFMKDRQ